MSTEIDRVLEINQAPAGQPTPPSTAKEYGGIGRAGYLLGMAGATVLNYLFSLAGEPGLTLFGFLIAIVLSFVLVVDRLHNIGMSGWWSLLILVPIANLFIWVRCAICPKGYQDTKKLDTAGRVLGMIIIAFLILVVIGIIVDMSAS